jgi:hypothetical protein
MAIPTRVCETQLQQAMDKAQPTDVKLMVGDKWEASAHCSVLMARSRVFAAMFTNLTVEKETGEINLEGVSVDGLLLFLQFIYLGMLYT